ncbi:hypothetical protein [Streptomyces lydicus]|uniref:hypothetical protein n=1 Tax=Streptomyces lydicus TaxID=47763 RepID=UPI000F8F04A1|nr:hypothetical protein [Streptomyces lydicus]
MSRTATRRTGWTVLPQPVFAPTRRKRTAQLAAQWHHLQQQRAHTRGAHLVQVVQVYQRARRGSKAVISWCDTGLRQDAWFWNWHVPPGAYLLVSGQSGYGPHNRNPSVLHVHQHQVHTWAPAQAARAAQRLCP